MTRAVDATLHAALQAGKGKIIATGYIGYGDGTVSKSGPVSQFKLTGTTLQFTIPNITTFAGDQTHIWLERGLTIAGTDYTITTGRFAIHNQRYLPNHTQVIDAGLFPNSYYSGDGYQTYDTVINAFCTTMGKTAVYREAGEAWHAYKFLGTGQYLVCPDAMSILTLLQQKRLIQMCDLGSEEVLVFCTDVYGATDLTITLKDAFQIDHSMLRNRQFIWKDELNVYHQAGTGTDPIHNLGYLESTDAAPARHAATHQLSAILRPDLRILDGDRISFNVYTSSFSLFARVIEQMEADTRGVPQWRTIVQANTVFNNTEGGSVPASVEKTAHYIPINTGAFDNNLSAEDNNLQHALDTLDDLVVTVPPAAGSWTEIVKTADQDVTNSTALANDNELTVTLASAGTYMFELILLYSGDLAADDYKFDFNFSAGPIGWHRFIASNTTADAINVTTGVRDNGSFAAALTAGTDAFDQLRVGFLEAMWTFGASSIVTFRFAQNTAGVGHHARTRTGSILRYRQIV